jgi:anti-sigma B factor antagonist
MEIVKKSIHGHECYGIRGEMDMNNAPTVKRIIDQLIRKGVQRIILDLSETKYIDSTGIGVAITTMLTLRKTQGDLILLSLTPDIRTLLFRTNILSYFTIIDDPEDLMKISP